MSTSVPFQNNAVNTTDFEELARINPQYTGVLLGLTKIDAFVKNVCDNAICNMTDPDAYSIKTEISPTSYLLYLYNSERNAIVGTVWPISTFLEECQSKTIESDVVAQITKIISRFGDDDLETEGKINWV